MSEIKFRDPVHNFVDFNDDELKVINSDLLQRLRGIKQLAMASLVYPGALHTRFEHTLGVAHVAGQMSRALNLDSDERRLVRLAGLLHDVGHGPFSHVSEYALERFAKNDSLPKSLRKEKIHEVITGHLIRNHPGLIKILGKETCRDIAKLLATGYGNPILKQIVSGPLDSDKQDYLLRDSLFAGVNYGKFDIHQLHRTITVGGPEGQKELMIRFGGVNVIEQFVLAKYFLTTMVYRHKVRLITDQMIVRAIVLGIEREELPELIKLYVFDDTASYYKNYLNWSDARLLFEVGRSAGSGSKCKELLEKLIRRDLLKRVFQLPVKEFSSDLTERLMAIGKKENANLRSKIEKDLAKLIGQKVGASIRPEFTILHTYQIQSVRTSAKNNEAGILVEKAGLLGKFEDESVLFSSIDGELSSEYVEVYAPVHWPTRADREKLLKTLKDGIKDIISDGVKAVELLLQL